MSYLNPADNHLGLHGITPATVEAGLQVHQHDLPDHHGRLHDRLGLGFLSPSLGSTLSIPSLVVAGASYGLGVGPVPYILMSSLFTQKDKSRGVAISLTCRSFLGFVQMKVTNS